ncbi:MAG: hypothetical protein Q9225_006012 [Loekoesia sp. 1 TL-2023]
MAQANNISANMSTPSRQISDGMLNLPTIKPSQTSRLKSKTLITMLVELNPKAHWSAFTPELISSTYESFLGKRFKPAGRERAKEEFRKSINVNKFHTLLSDKFSEVPDLPEFCKAFGLPYRTREEEKYDSSDFEDWYDKDTELLISFPIAYGGGTSTPKSKVVILVGPRKSSTSDSSTDDCEYSWKNPVLQLSFNSASKRDIAYRNLKNNRFKINNGPAFKFKVQRSREHKYRSQLKRNLLWRLAFNCCEIPELLQIITQFLPYNHHVPVYTIHWFGLSNHSAFKNTPYLALGMSNHMPMCLREHCWYVEAECPEVPHEIEVVNAHS